MNYLYVEMKSALKFFGLSFHEMDKVNCKIENQCLIFSYSNKSIKIEIN